MADKMPKMTDLSLCPVSLKEANNFVATHHRHHQPVTVHKFSIGCRYDGILCGVAIINRPVSIKLDDGLTLEVARLCTDGTPNACSLLYAAAWRAARAMGYQKIITYILASETGASLRAANWKCVGEAGCLEWRSKRETERARQLLLFDKARPPKEKKVRYEKC
jgi:hypothetical protein